jgi:hypothetical protein
VWFDESDEVVATVLAIFEERAAKAKRQKRG